MKFLTSLYRRVFPPPTTDQIVASFEKTRAKLEACRCAKFAEADAQRDLADRAFDAARAAEAEAQRATRVANRLAEILD